VSQKKDDIICPINLLKNMAGRENERETKRGWNSHFPAYG
jgi:hypothetical protein